MPPRYYGGVPDSEKIPKAIGETTHFTIKSHTDRAGTGDVEFALLQKTVNQEGTCVSCTALWLFKEKLEIRSVTLTVSTINVAEQVLPLKHKYMTLSQKPDNFTCKVP